MMFISFGEHITPSFISNLPSRCSLHQYDNDNIMTDTDITKEGNVAPTRAIITRRAEITSGLSALRSVRPFVRLSKRPAKRTSARPTAADRDHSAEFARAERTASRDPPHSARRSSNGSSNPGLRFRPDRDRCAAGAKRYEGIHGSNTRRNGRPANASGNPSESRARTGTLST